MAPSAVPTLNQIQNFVNRVRIKQMNARLDQGVERMDNLDGNEQFVEGGDRATLEGEFYGQPVNLDDDDQSIDGGESDNLEDDGQLINYEDQSHEQPVNPDDDGQLTNYEDDGQSNNREHQPNEQPVNLTDSQSSYEDHGH
jgi:hypothetical protein